MLYVHCRFSFDRHNSAPLPRKRRETTAGNLMRNIDMIEIKTATAALWIVLPLIAVGAGSVQADDWRDGRGRGGPKGGYKYEEKYDPRTGRYKVEEKRPGYKYEYERGPAGHRVVEKRGRKHARRHHRKIRREFGYGPPPWAPAHGYRAKHGRDTRVYVERHVYIERPYAAHGHVVDPGHIVDLPDAGIGRCNRDALGAIIGGASGALIGSQFGKGDGKTAATIGGAIIGLLVGGNVGRAMDQVDHNCIGQVLERAPTGQAVAWESPDDGHHYQVTPTRTYQAESGEYCREYTTTVMVGGRPQNAYGTACRQPDGSWKKQI